MMLIKKSQQNTHNTGDKLVIFGDYEHIAKRVLSIYVVAPIFLSQHT